MLYFEQQMINSVASIFAKCINNLQTHDTMKASINLVAA
jgi:hypothetical protein